MQWLREFAERRRAIVPFDYSLWVPTLMYGSAISVAGASALQRGFERPWLLALAFSLAVAPILLFLFAGVKSELGVTLPLTLVSATMFFFLWPPVVLDATPFLLFFVAGEIAALSRLRATALATAACAALLVTITIAHRNPEPLIYMLFLLMFACSIGLILQLQQRLLLQVRQTQASLTEQAAGEERRRIAREVHDVVAHSLSITLLHLTGARRALQEEQDVDDAVAGLLDAERLGRQAMADIRRTVGLLGEGRAGAHATAPEPDASDICALVADFAQAGVVVDYRVDGDLEAVSAWVGLGLYRVAQESLANIAKHAPRSRATLRLRIARGSAALSVVNDMPEPAPHPHASTGTGLAGMRQRVELLGGALRTGPDPAGWAVRAEIPLGQNTPSCGSRFSQAVKSYGKR